jgi:dienelactone hydrolase
MTFLTTYRGALGAALALSAALFVPAASAQSQAASVQIPAQGFMLNAAIYVPNSQGPWPAVVALHGCGGPDLKAGSRESDWAMRMQAAGFAVVIPDSFGSRGLGSQCRVKERDVRNADRVGDLRATVDWLVSQREIKANAISLIGWSNGATTILKAARPNSRDGKHLNVQRAFAFYPGCQTYQRSGTWVSRIPLTILTGSEDNWTPSASCVDMVAQARMQGAPVDIVAYPGAYHDFDHPNMPLRQRSGLAYSGDGSGNAIQGTNPQARSDAITRVLAGLAR